MVNRIQGITGIGEIWVLQNDYDDLHEGIGCVHATVEADPGVSVVGGVVGAASDGIELRRREGDEGSWY